MALARGGHQKYVWFSASGEEQLFDLDRDPRELKDLSRAPKAAAALKAWRRRLAKELQGREEGFASRPVTNAPPRSSPRFAPRWKAKG